MENQKEKSEVSHELDKVIVRFLQARDKWTFGSKDKIFLFRELSYLLKWGVWIIESFKLIFHSTDNFAVKTIAKNISQHINQWKTLSYSISRLPDYFDEWDINIIKAGEKSGNLAEVLASLSQEYSYINTIKNKYIWALLYPSILVIVAIVAFIWLFAIILPEIFKVVASFPGVEMPTTTRILKWLSDFLLQKRKVIIGVLLGVFILLFAFFSTNTWKRIFYSFLVELPLIWRMTKYFYLIKWCRYMKIMLSAWMSYIEIFLLLRDILNIPLYQDMIERILAELQKWNSIYYTLKSEQALIPVNVATLIKVGEESANLWNSIQNILNIYSEELEVQIDRLSKVIEPIMLILIWVMVLVIAFWVFGLIFQVMEWAGL